MRSLALLAALAVLLSATDLWADPVPAAVGSDPPIDAAHPSGMTPVAIPTHGVKINAVLYTAAGVGPHPVVILFHGLPGFEENLDLAQAMRRDGWDVLTLHYRGAFGSPGGFSFTHCLEDAAAAIAWLRSPDGGVAAGVDRGKIVLLGHSMGGWVAAMTFAKDPALMGVGLISAANLGGAVAKAPRAALEGFMSKTIGTDAGLRPLEGTSAAALADEAIRNAPAWDFVTVAKAIGAKPLLVVTANDGLAAQSQALADAVAKGEDAAVTQVHLATDHSYSDQRIALEAAVLRWLENLPGAPEGL